MSIEEKLKDLILTKYRSLREFTLAIDIPYSTMSTILKRGIENANIQNIIKICQALEISADELAEGRIVPVTSSDDSFRSIESIFTYAKQQLLTAEKLTINNKPVNPAEIDSIVNSLDLILEIEKRNYKG